MSVQEKWKDLSTQRLACECSTSITHNNQKVGTTQMSINCWVDKQNVIYSYERAMSLQSCLTLCDFWAVVCRASLSMEFSRQEYWSGLPCPSPWTLQFKMSSRPRDEIHVSYVSSTGRRFFTTSPTWEAHYIHIYIGILFDNQKQWSTDTC